MGCCSSKSNAEELSNDIKNIPVYIPKLINVPVIKVYDGDTITIAVKIDKTYYKYRVRLSGIDTPEIKTNNEREKQRAIQAREYLSSLILHKNVHIKDVFYEKYGRLCGTIYYKNKNINQTMIDSGCAVSYNGGKKPTW